MFVRCTVLLALGVAFCAASARRADATCGDYLSHASDARNTHMMPDGTHDSAANAADANRNDSQSQKAPAPRNSPCHCEGPACSNGSGIPIQHESRIRITTDRWTWQSDSDAARNGELSERVPDDAVALTDGHALGILRPPR